MILYLHGFGSNGNSNKSKILNEHFSESIISPTLEIEPEKAIDQILNILENDLDSNKTIIGTSLGGFYGMYILSKIDIPVILINPSLNPGHHLLSKIGINKNYNTNEEFEWKEDYNKQLNIMESNICNNQIASYYLNLLLSTDDELLDHSYLQSAYNPKTCVYFDNSGHRFTRFEDAIPYVKKTIDFYKN